MSQAQYTTIYFKSPNKNSKQPHGRHQYLRKFKQQFCKLSESFKTELKQEKFNVFKVKRFKRQLFSFTEKDMETRNVDKVTRQKKWIVEQNGEKKVRQLPTIEIKRISEQDKSKSKESSVVQSQDSQQSQSKIKSARYSLAPHLNLQKTIYLFKKQSLDPQMNQYLTTEHRKEKSFQLQQGFLKRLDIEKLTETQQLKGLKTTLYKKQVIKRSKPIESLHFKEKKNNYLRQNIRQSVAVAKAEDFTPWHIPQHSIIL